MLFRNKSCRLGHDERRVDKQMDALPVSLPVRFSFRRQLDVEIVGRWPMKLWVTLNSLRKPNFSTPGAPKLLFSHVEIHFTHSTFAF